MKGYDYEMQQRECWPALFWASFLCSTQTPPPPHSLSPAILHFAKVSSAVNKGPSCKNYVSLGPAWNIGLCHSLLPYWERESVRKCTAWCQNKTNPPRTVKASIHVKNGIVSHYVFPYIFILTIVPSFFPSRLLFQLSTLFPPHQNRSHVRACVSIPSRQTRLAENLMARCWKPPILF